MALEQVVETGGFEAAADELHISQSAISQRIKNLESQIGQIVVLRTKPARPTAMGKLLLRFARQITLAQEELHRRVSEERHGAAVSIRIAANADSLDSWVLPALAPLAAKGIALDIRRQDEHLSAELLKSGEVMAAITAEHTPLQGCSITKLGAMPYFAACTPRFKRQWFPGGMTLAGLGTAPLVRYDHNDSLESRFMHRISATHVDPPTHFVPTSRGYNDAVALGFGWGLIPGLMLRETPGSRFEKLSEDPLLVPLYWQQWRVSSPSLDAVAKAVVVAGRDALLQ